MNNDNELRIKEKVDFFMQEQIKIHVELKDRTFLNGFIDRKSKENVYWFIDNKLSGIFLFIRDIYDIDQFKEKER